MGTILYSNQYDGPRWTYGMSYRPVIPLGNVPDGWIILSNQEHPDFMFGTIDYPFELTAEQVKRFELTFVKGPDDE